MKRRWALLVSTLCLMGCGDFLHWSATPAAKRRALEPRVEELRATILKARAVRIEPGPDARQVADRDKFNELMSGVVRTERLGRIKGKGGGPLRLFVELDGDDIMMVGVDRFPTKALDVGGLWFKLTDQSLTTS